MFAVGIDIGGTNIKAGIVRHDRRLLSGAMSPLPDDPRDAVTAIADLIANISRKARLSESAIRHVGCGVPGLLDRRRNILLTSPNITSWKRIPLRRRLEQRLGKTVILENDANLAAYGEHWAGAARGWRNVIAVTIGTGIGGGIILDGNLWRGASGCAAEIGHVVVHPGGRRCGCGRRGCVEQYASAGAIVRAFRRFGGDATPSTAREIFREARKGCAAARSAIRECAGALATALAGLVSVIEPDVFVLSGGVSQSGSYLRSIVRREIDLLTPSYLRKTYRVVSGSLGAWAGVFGAAAWALHHSSRSSRIR